MIDVKKEIIAKHENGVRVSDLATQFGMAKSTICTILNPLNTELNPICHLLALLGNHPILHVSRIRVKNRQTIKKADVARSCEKLKDKLENQQFILL